MKYCAQCDKTKPVEAFRELKGIRPGRDPWCMECRSAYNKAYYGLAKKEGRR